MSVLYGSTAGILSGPRSITIAVWSNESDWYLILPVCANAIIIYDIDDVVDTQLKACIDICQTHYAYLKYAYHDIPFLRTAENYLAVTH